MRLNQNVFNTLKWQNCVVFYCQRAWPRVARALELRLLVGNVFYYVFAQIPANKRIIVYKLDRIRKKQKTRDYKDD